MIAQRRFSLGDQRAFAALSGDWNPLHVDPIAARRTLFGAPIVHGVHLVMWALDRVIDAERGIGRLTASFRRPAFLDRDIVLDRVGDRLVATLDRQPVLELEVVWAEVRDREVEAASWPELVAPAIRTKDQIEGCYGEAAVACDITRAATLLPTLASRLPQIQLAELLATTRVVGMSCPGLHSIYTGLQLEQSAGSSEVRFAVKSYAHRFSAITLGIEGPTLAGTLEAFFRPPPIEIDVAAVAKRVMPGEFSDRRALIVGGTRGLGEALAKAIAVGGGQICVTYRSGADDAARVVREIGAGYGIPLDVADPGQLQARWPAPWKPTHVYYCATPQIRLDRTGTFSAADHERYVACYVTGLVATLHACHTLTEAPFTAWAPSTTFLDGHERAAAAYCLAKIAMEELRHHLPGWVRLTTPRLPRVATDQTAALIAGSMADPIDVVLEQLRSGA